MAFGPPRQRRSTLLRKRANRQRVHVSEPAIVIAGLTKDYGSGRGIFDLDLEVASGEILGFIGPNGAGKTTTIRLLMDFVRPSCGSARILGLAQRRGSVT